MKKALVLALTLLLCLSICACEQSPTQQPNYNYESNQESTPVQTKPKEFSAYDAYLVANRYIEDFYNSALKAEVRKANSIDYFKIGSYNTKKEDDQFYYFVFHGTFAARDKYGDLLDFYKYSWEIKINKFEHKDFNIYLDNDGYGDIYVQKD